MNNIQGVSPNKGKQGTTRGKESKGTYVPSYVPLLSLRRDSPS